MRGVKELSLEGRRVILRVDFNVPMKDGVIADDTRIRASLPTIECVLRAKASLVLMSHLGRPKGRDMACTLAPCAKRLSELLERDVRFIPECVDIQKLRPGEVVLLENLRFHAGEEEPDKDPSFAKALAQWGDVYVDDAFAAAHRDHASITRITQYFGEQKAAGLLMQKEVEVLSQLLQHPARPFYAIMGGAKISTKLGVIHNLLKHVDGLFLGGAMTYSFLKARGISVGDSLCEESEIPKVKPLLSEPKIHFPTDIVISDKVHTRTVSLNEGIPVGWEGMDVGPNTVPQWMQTLKGAATIFWNGPVGVFEKTPFAHGTRALAQELARLCKKGTNVVIGGGDSVYAIEQMGLSKKFTHLSTGGGASLEYLENGTLPGIDALTKN